MVIEVFRKAALHGMNTQRHGFSCSLLGAVGAPHTGSCLWKFVSNDHMRLQNARQNTTLPQQQQGQLGQGLGSFGGAGINASQQNTLASLLAGAYSQSPGVISERPTQGI